MPDGRVDELRKRLEKEPGSRLFAQLAEELRKAGQTDEAIQVAREGLQKHPAYHSARMTLARALMDTGDLASARPEFEAVLKGAADNILASRLLGECLEGLGDLSAARARFKTTLAMAPGDKQVQAHLEAVEARLSGPAPASPPPAAAEAPPAPSAPPADVEPPPIPLVAADEPFELEATYEAPAVRTREEPVEPAAAPAPAAAPGPPPAAVEPEQEFVDFEAEAQRQTTAPIEIISRVPLVDADGLEPAPAAVPSPAPAEAPPAPVAASQAELASPTLGELYFSQGHLDKAIDVYRQIVDREPGNERASGRLGELRALQAAVPEPAPAAASPAPGGRRAAIERTISRLEGMLSAVRRG